MLRKALIVGVVMALSGLTGCVEKQEAASAASAGELPAEIAGGAMGIAEPKDDLKSAVRSYERRHIEQVLSATGGNREEAARRLGIDASTLYRRLKDFEV